MLRRFVAIYPANDLNSWPCWFFSPWFVLPVIDKGCGQLMKWLMGYAEQESGILIGIQGTQWLRGKMKYCLNFACNMLIYLTCSSCNFNQQHLRFCMRYADASQIMFRNSKFVEIELFQSWLFFMDFACNVLIYLTCGACNFNQRQLRFCMRYATVF